MRVLVELEVALCSDAANLEALWATPWLVWLDDLLGALPVADTPANDDDRAALVVRQQALHLLRRAMLFELGRKTGLAALRAVPELGQLQLLAVDVTLAYFERRPCLDNDATQQSASSEAMAGVGAAGRGATSIVGRADLVVKQLYALMQLALEQEPAPALLARLFDTINALSTQNAPSVRATMKSCGMFELRDALLIALLRPPALPPMAPWSSLAHSADGVESSRARALERASFLRRKFGALVVWCLLVAQ
jgi:hypothetical protein